MEELDKYRTGENSAEELEAITKKLLKQKFDGELRAKLQRQLAQEQNVYRTPRLQPRRWRWVLGIAAALALLLLGWRWMTPGTDDYLALTEQYLATPHPNGEVRKGSEELLELEARAIAAYAEGDFAAAAKYYEQLRQELASTPLTLIYYLGLSYLYQDAQVERAIPYLRTVAEGSNARLADEADWYLSLALIKSQQLEEARQLLQKRVQLNAWQAQRAKQLLAALP